MARGDPLLSPWIWEARDNEQEVIRITVTFNDATKVITGMTSFRDSGCAYTRLLIGSPADGIPDDTDKVITVPAGTRALTPAQLQALATKGLNTITDILALQITAAP